MFHPTHSLDLIITATSTFIAHPNQTRTIATVSQSMIADREINLPKEPAGVAGQAVMQRCGPHSNGNAGALARKSAVPVERT